MATEDMANVKRKATKDFYTFKSQRSILLNVTKLRSVEDSFDNKFKIFWAKIKTN